MPGRILTAAERERLDRFPEEISHQDILTHFTLSPMDKQFIGERRGEHNRLGVALQLMALRYLGFCPKELNSVPTSVVNYVAKQLEVSPGILSAYGTRDQTRTSHLQEIQVYLGFRQAKPEDLEMLAKWLVERAMEHDKPTLLLQLAAQKLQASKIVRIGITRLEQMVATARQLAHKETFQRLEPLLTQERQVFLDSLLLYNPTIGSTALTWLRRHATTNSPGAILNAIAKLEFLNIQNVPQWDVSSLNPNRLKFLAQMAKRSSNQALQRLHKERRYPILTAFVYQIYEEVTDETIDLYIYCLADTYARARRELDEFRRNAAKAINEKIRLFRELGSVVVDTNISDAQVRPLIYKRISPEQLQGALADCERLMRPADDNYFDFLANRYGHLRKFVPTFLAAFTFHSNRQPDPLLAAIALIRDLDLKGKRKVPESAPLKFIPAKWDEYIVNQKGQIARRYYELCLLWELRTALRAGNVWLLNSRRYANPESYLLPQDQWFQMRLEICQLLQTPPDGAQQLQQLQTELEEQLSQLNQTLKNNDKVRLEDGKLVLSPLKAEELPESRKILQKVIGTRLPWVDLTQLLIEVDKWTGFSRRLIHAEGNSQPTQEARIYLYAALIAIACNMGLYAMAKAADLSYDRLVWYTNWYLQEDALPDAINAIVNFQYHQPLSHYWGGGNLSSSDGQRFPVAVKNRQAVALPRYFGYGRGVTFYTWTSDQHSQYRDKVIPSTVRDATYVLDGILDNETELAILEHTTDTTGFTEVVFALFALLGLQFSPRIRDLADQRLYRMSPDIEYPHLELLFKGKINQNMILERWDDLLRVAGSLKLGWVTASLFIGKLQSFEQKNALFRALQEYGRLLKTIFILRYLNNEDYQRRIGRQLNKGERLHDLRRFLCFANQGQIRRRQDEDLASQSHCLTLVTNAVVAWNTVYMAAAIEQLRTEGYQIQDEDITHLSPTRHEHINPHGKYKFDIDVELRRKALRPLREG